MRPTYLLLKRCLLFALFFSFTLSAVFSQTTGYSGTGKNIDVTYQRCEWRINPDSSAKGIKGDVTIYFVTKAASVSSFTLDLRRSAFSGSAGSVSAKYHGTATTVTFPTTGDSIRISLPSSLALNTFDSVTISYNGAPPAVARQAEGYQKKGTVGSNAYIYTLSESYEDRDWWPCKADMQDKIDSMDIYINTPSAFTAVTNGKLIDSVTVGANQIFHWKLQYPIPSYLVAVGVARYRVYDRGTVNISGTNVPVWYFLFPGKTAANYTSILTALDYSKAELTAFSSKFGDYPFKNEKHGYYEFGWGGGMEHQSISAMGSSVLTSWGTIAHELGHQWFGDKVTFGTWNHLWLAEGFARYMEALAAELVPALGQSAATERLGFKTAANNATNRAFSCYIPNGTITTSDVLWSSAYGSTVYERGAMVVSMLRTLLGDAKFFQACRNYLNDPALAYRSATTDDLRNHMQAVAGGYDLTPFFNSYVYGNGYPLYSTSIRWGNPGSNRISFKVTTQTKSAGSTVSYYHTPIAIRVQGVSAGQDTVLVIYDQNGQLSRGGDGISVPTAGSYIYFMLGFNPVTVTFDPFNQTLATGAALTFDNTDPLLQFTTLDVKIADFTLRQQSSKNELYLDLTDTEGELQSVVLQKGATSTEFIEAGEMQLTGVTTGVTKRFAFSDNQPFQGATYYRAMITEKTGLVRYSKVLVANGTASLVLSVYPNPADNEVSVRWNGGSGDLRIIAMGGHVVKTVRSLTNMATLSVADLPAGVYLVELRKEGVIVSRQKLVVKR
jgi:hypothetical protein